MPWAACIDVTGADAAEFLQGQLTNDVPADAERFTLAAWNDARGRVRALFRVLCEHDRCVLLAERENVESVLAKLRMYVLRAKVLLATNEGLRVAAIVGDSDAWLTERGVRLHADPGSAARAAGVAWLRAGPGLIHAVGPAAAVDEIGAALPPASAADAELAEIRLGLPRVGTATELRYVPQMLNLDRLGAISFTKGCYPGQEVVARLHHLGSVKRRMRRFRGEGPASPPPAPGTELVDAGGTAVGEVVRAATDGASTELLAVVQLDALGAPVLAPGGVPLVSEPLPYDD